MLNNFHAKGKLNNYGDKAFSVVAPTDWIKLPIGFASGSQNLTIKFNPKKRQLYSLDVFLC